MKIDRSTPDAEKYTVHDCTGQVIPYVTFFDTDTFEIEMAICLRVDHVAPEEGEASDPEWLAESIKQVPKFLSQTYQADNGESQVGYTFVRFVLPGAFAACEGQKIDQTN